jgi:hypothetical protein
MVRSLTGYAHPPLHTPVMLRLVDHEQRLATSSSRKASGEFTLGDREDHRDARNRANRPAQRPPDVLPQPRTAASAHHRVAHKLSIEGLSTYILRMCNISCLIGDLCGIGCFAERRLTNSRRELLTSSEDPHGLRVRRAAVLDHRAHQHAAGAKKGGAKMRRSGVRAAA